MDFNVEGRPDLVKRSGVVTSVDRAAYLEYVARRRAQQTDKERIRELEDIVSDLSRRLTALEGKVK